MTTARQNQPGRPRPAETDDPLLAEAMALTWRDYEGAFDQVKAEPWADEVRVAAERTSGAIRSDPRLSAFADQPEFVGWAVYEVARGKRKKIPKVSADEAKAALNEPHGRLVTHLLEVLERQANSAHDYVRDPLRVVLDDRRAWAGGVGKFAPRAVDDLHVAHQLGVDVLQVAGDRGLDAFDVLAAMRRARSRAARDPSWYKADQDDRNQRVDDAFKSGLTATDSGEPGSETTGPGPYGQPACGSSLCVVSRTPLGRPPLPRETGWARKTDPCHSIDYLRYLVYTYAIGENGHLFQAGDIFVDRWARATNWCWPEEAAGQTEQSAANCQSFDDRLYWLRRRNARTDTVYAMRAEIYQEQLENPAIAQAWLDFVAQVEGYLSAPCSGAKKIPSYRCLGVYTAAEALRRAAAAQMTGLARMQIKELACSLQILLRLFSDPRVIVLIDPAAAAAQPACDSGADTGKDPDDQAAVVFAVVQQLLGPQASCLYQAWDRAVFLDRVFAWVQRGHVWHPRKGCEQDPDFLKLLGAVSALESGAGRASSNPSASLTTVKA